MLSETPVSSAICLTPEPVLTRSTMSGGNRECIWRGSLSSFTFHSSFMFRAFAGVRIFSSFCQFVRCGLLPSVSQSAPHAVRQPSAIRSVLGILCIGSPLQFLEPDVPNADLAGSFDLEANQTALAELSRIIIDQDGHDVAVDDVSHGISARDEVQLIPIVDVNVPGERLAIAERGQQAGAFALFGMDHLAAPRDDPTPSGLLIELAGVAIAAVEVELRAQHVPLGL